MGGLCCARSGVMSDACPGWGVVKRRRASAVRAFRTGLAAATS